jgi:molecular chaperone DnaK (HSP70)
MTTLTDGLTGAGAQMRLTRDELDDAIRPSLDRFLASLEETLARNGIQDLVAVVSAGGGANIPAVATALSRRLRVPVVTAPRPQLTAAIGGALRVERGPGESSATLTASPAPVTAAVRTPQKTAAAPATAAASPAETATGVASARAWSATVADSPVPSLGADQKSGDEAAKASESSKSSSKRKRLLTRWYGLPAMALVATVIAVLLLVGTAVAVELNKGNNPTTTPAVSTNKAPSAPPAGATAEPAPPQEVPPPTADASPPAETKTSAASAPAASAPAAIPRAAPPAAAAPAAPVMPQAPSRIPPIPGINEPIPGLDRVNQIIQGIEGDLNAVAQAPPR